MTCKDYFRGCISVFLLAFNFSLSAQLEKDSLFCLEIRGRIEFSQKTSKSYKVRLYWNNQVIDSQSVKNGKPFIMHLKRNEMYGLVFSKKGYYPRLINIDTRISEADKNIYLFDFETTLLKKSRSEKLDPDALDYPIAIVAYDDRMIGFYYNEEYTGAIKRDIYRNTVKSRYRFRKISELK
jgi:hypothetical protein